MLINTALYRISTNQKWSRRETTTAISLSVTGLPLTVTVPVMAAVCVGYTALVGIQSVKQLDPNFSDFDVFSVNTIKTQTATILCMPQSVS